MNKLKIRKMDSKTKLNLLGSYCSAIGLLMYRVIRGIIQALRIILA